MSKIKEAKALSKAVHKGTLGRRKWRNSGFKMKMKNAIKCARNIKMEVLKAMKRVRI